MKGTSPQLYCGAAQKEKIGGVYVFKTHVPIRRKPAAGHTGEYRFLQYAPCEGKIAKKHAAAVLREGKAAYYICYYSIRIFIMQALL